MKNLITGIAAILLGSTHLNMAVAGDHQHHDHNHDYAHEHHADHHDHAHHGHNHAPHSPHQAAHEHGVANMSLTIVGHDALIEVKSPMYNVVGFEHHPKNDQQKQLVKQQIAAIKGAALFEFSADAQCKVIQHSIVNPFHQHKHEHNHQNNHETSAHKTHNDLSFEYQLHCKTPEKITLLNAQPLFKAWPNMQQLRVEWIYKDHQSALTLTPKNPAISFK